MNKLFWLTFIMGFICFASVAQQANDSVANQQLHAATGFSSISNFSYTLREFNKIFLQWSIDSAVSNDYFVVEHGKDTSHFETMGVFKRIVSSTQYDLMDNNPSNGINCYRIKCTDSTGLAFYSKVLKVNLLGNAGFKFYPNPADKLLIIETAHPADLQILNPAGNVLVNKQLQSGMQVINVSSLEKGEYLIRAVYKEGNQVILDHLIKN